VKFAKLMNKHFTMNDLGDVSYYLEKVQKLQLFLISLE